MNLSPPGRASWRLAAGRDIATSFKPCPHGLPAYHTVSYPFSCEARRWAWPVVKSSTRRSLGLHEFAETGVPHDIFAMSNTLPLPIRPM